MAFSGSQITRLGAMAGAAGLTGSFAGKTADVGITHVRTVDGAADASGATETINIQVSGTNPVLIVKTATKGSGITVTGVVYNTSENLTQEKTDINVDARADLWYLASPTVTTADVVITYSSANRNVASASVYSGVDQTTPIRSGSASANGTDATATVNITATLGDMIVDAVGQVSAGPDTAAGNRTERHDFASTGGGTDTRGAGQEFLATGGADTMSYTMGSSDNWAIVAMALRTPFVASNNVPAVYHHRHHNKAG